MRRFLWSAAALLVCDQASKILIYLERAEIPPRGLQLIGDFARLRCVLNEGAAFSLFHGNRFVFIGISVLSSVVVLLLVRSRRYVFRGSHIAFGLVFGGALGNLIDRLWLGKVIDFLDIGFGVHRWPTFNVADIGVTLGVLFLAVALMAADREATHSEAPQPPFAQSEPSDE